MLSPPRIVKHGEGRYTLHYTDRGGAEASLDCGLVMMATGRKPNVEGLGLEVGGEGRGEEGD